MDMNASTAVVIVVILAVVAFAVRHLVRVTRGKDGCCSGEGGAEGPRRTRAAKVQDTDPAHYPHVTELTVRGMSCEGCVENVQNALNALPDTWASVDLASRKATVRTKKPGDPAAMERAIEAAGYSVIHL